MGGYNFSSVLDGFGKMHKFSFGPSSDGSSEQVCFSSRMIESGFYNVSMDKGKIAPSVLFMALTVPLFSMLDGASFLTIVLIQIAFGALLTINDGTLPCFLSEIFPTRVRYSGFAFSFNAANALFGGTAPFVATWLISVTGSKLAPAWYLVGAAALALVAMLMARETAGKPLED